MTLNPNDLLQGIDLTKERIIIDNNSWLTLQKGGDKLFDAISSAGLTLILNNYLEDELTDGSRQWEKFLQRMSDHNITWHNINIDGFINLKQINPETRRLGVILNSKGNYLNLGEAASLWLKENTNLFDAGPGGVS